MPSTVASIDVTLRLLGSDTFQARMRESGSVSEQTGGRVRRAMDGIASSTDRVGRSADSLSRTDAALRALGGSALRAEISITSLSRGMSLFNTAVGGLVGGAALNAFKNYADAATNIQNRLAAVLPMASERAAIDEKIYETAQRTRTSYEATANLFSRLTLSAGQLGATQSDVLRVVETTQKALQAGGATPAESASIATQLTQALGSGRLAGDELRSIAENSPVLIQAIAREFGVTVGALKDMGSNGELAADRVFKAILRAGSEVDEVFGRMKPSIAAGIVQIDNALTRYIGNVDKSVGATNALVGGLQFVAKNLDTIGDSAALAVAAVAGPLAARFLGGAGSRVAAPFRDARASAADGLDVARGALSSATEARQAAQAGVRQAETRLSTVAERAGAAAFTGSASVGAYAQRARAAEDLARAEGALLRAGLAEQEAQGRVAAAAARTSTAQVALAGTVRTASAAFSGLVGLLGGPFGAALTAASVGFIGYELYQARAAAAVERHTEALGKLATRLEEVSKATGSGQARTTVERLADDKVGADAVRAVRDRRDRVLGAFDAASIRADLAAGNLAGEGLGGMLPNDIDKAAQRLGINLQQVARDARTLQPASAEATAATAALARVLVEAASADPRYRDKALEADEYAKKQEQAAETARKAAEAFKAADELAKGAGNRKAVYDGDGLGPLVAAPRIDAAETTATLKSIEAYAKSVGDSLGRIGDQSYSFPELAQMREQLQGAVQDIATVRAQAPTMLSGLRVPVELLETVQAFARGQESAEGYAERLQKLRDQNPNFAPLIDSLAQANAKALAASATLAEVGAKVDALDGKSANISVTVTTTSIARIKMDDAKAVEDQAAAADKALTDLKAKTRNLQLQAGGETARAKALEFQGSNPGVNLRDVQAEYERQEKLQEQISARGRKGGGGGRRSPEQRAADTLAKKLEELDQDAGVSALNSFDQKTVRFAQSAKVAAEQIQAFIAAAKSGDLSGVPPVMGQIYEKMKLLEGVKLARSTLDELFPARKLARELEELRAAANASPEIAANLDKIEQHLREKNAPEWAERFSTSFGDMAKSIVGGTATAADALTAFKSRIVSIALDEAFKPLEGGIRSLLGGLSSSTSGGGIGGFLGSLFTLSPIPGFAAGGIIPQRAPGAAIGAGGRVELPE